MVMSRPYRLMCAALGADHAKLHQTLLTRCEPTRAQVHLIIRHKSPLTGEIEEKHLKFPPSVLTDSDTHVYTAILHTNNTCVDGPLIDVFHVRKTVSARLRSLTCLIALH